MKIFIDQFCLSNGGNESPKDLTIHGERAVQSVPLLRGAAGVFSRGNRVNTVAFAVTREHADYGAAEAFLWQHATALPASGSLELWCEATDGNGVRYTAAVSAVVSDKGSQNGLTTTHQYLLKCGEIVEG